MPFNHTGTLEASVVAELIRVGLIHTNQNGIVNYALIEQEVPVNYNRGWLIVRYAWLELHQPELLLDLNAERPKRAAEQARISAERLAESKLASGAESERLATLALDSRYNEDRHLIGAIAAELREQELSWGEISVRMNTPESTIRRCFNKVSIKKDRGLRIGRGGRFAYGAPELYLENRKAEGAEIPLELRGRPKPEQLLNYKAPEQPKPVRAPRPKATPKAPTAAPLGSRKAKREAANKAS